MATFLILFAVCLRNRFITKTFLLIFASQIKFSSLMIIIANGPPLPKHLRR